MRPEFAVPDTTSPSAIELERREYRRRQNLNSVLISLLSTAIFAVVVWVGLSATPGWDTFRETFFDPAVFAESLPSIAAGLVLNIRVLFFAAIGVAVCATLLAIVRTLRGPVFFPLRFLAGAYTTIFRGVPLILVLYLVGFGLPALDLFPRLSFEFWGTIALILTYSAYVAEVLRAGIEAVHPSQRMASRALGLSHAQTLRLVVLPQGVRKVTPALMNDFVSMQKDVGLISVLGAVDAVRSAQIAVASSYNFTPYVVAGLLFILLSLPMILVTDWYTARAQRREQTSGMI